GRAVEQVINPAQVAPKRKKLLVTANLKKRKRITGKVVETDTSGAGSAEKAIKPTGRAVEAEVNKIAVCTRIL
ncbi:MAG: hypothetical protein L0922_08110, partial [Candidatus Mariimomonas ferrooxydans]